MTERIIGNSFRLVKELSSGGFGETFLAEDLRFPDLPKCVVKQLKPQSNDAKIVELAARLFEQEAKILYQLGEHSQIPTLIAHFEENGEFYLVQEFIKGETFAEELENGRIYNQKEVIEITTQLLEVLSFVHSKDVIHRDVKPSNLIRRKHDGKIFLIDFGAVKQVRNQFISPQNPHKQNTIAIGSDGFMPMEQLAGNPQFSSDIYAVGMFAVQLLTKSHPTQLRQSQRTGEWIWQDKTSVNPHFAEFLNKMIRIDYRQRFLDAINAYNYLRKLGLNLTNNSPVLLNQSEIPQVPNFKQTQVMYSVPNPQNNFPPIYSNQQHFQQFPQSQPTQVLTKVQTPNRINQTPSESSVLSLSTNLFDDPIIKTALVIGVIFIVLMFGISLLNTYSLNQQYAQPQPQPQNDIAKEFLRDKLNYSYKKEALDREASAITISDWKLTVAAWEKTADYFKNAKSLNLDQNDKISAANEEVFANERKYMAQRQIDKLKSTGSY